MHEATKEATKPDTYQYGKPCKNCFDWWVNMNCSGKLKKWQNMSTTKKENCQKGKPTNLK